MKFTNQESRKNYESAGQSRAKAKQIIGGFAIIIVLLVFCVYAIWFEQSRKHVIRLKPAIAFVESSIREHGCLPTQDEFQNWIEMDEYRMFTLRDRTDKYAQSQGATNVNDYMVGTWIADWYYYYKSWDKKYFDGFNELETAIKE